MPVFLFCLLALMWGGSFIAIKFVVLVIPPVMGALVRVALAFLFLLLIVRARKKPISLPLKTSFQVAFAGLFSVGLPFALLFWAEKSVTPGVAGIINGTVPIWTTLLAMIFLAKLEPVNGKKIFGLLLGTAGICSIFAPSLNLEELGKVYPLLALVGMAVCYSIGMLLNRQLLSGETKIDVLVNTVHQHFSSLLFLLVLVLLWEGNPIPVLTTQTTPQAAISLLYLALFSNAIAFLIFFYLIREWGAVRASTVTYIVPLVAITLDFLFLGSIPEWNEGLGIALILSGVFLIQSTSRPKSS